MRIRITHFSYGDERLFHWAKAFVPSSLYRNDIPSSLTHHPSQSLETPPKHPPRMALAKSPKRQGKTFYPVTKFSSIKDMTCGF